MTAKRKLKNTVDCKLLMEAIGAFFDKMLGGGHQVESIEATFDANEIIGQHTGFESWTYEFGSEFNVDLANAWLKQSVIEAFFKHMHPSFFELDGFSYDSEYWCFHVKAKV